jgi:hypothetical protein
MSIRANSTILAWVKRFLTTEAAITSAYEKAGSAMSERKTEVVITSGSFEGGGTAGQIAGDPEEIMAACEVALQELEAAAAGGVAKPSNGGAFYDFSFRRVGT